MREVSHGQFGVVSAITCKAADGGKDVELARKDIFCGNKTRSEVVKEVANYRKMSGNPFAVQVCTVGDMRVYSGSC